MACSGTRERDLARKYNLKYLRVNITRISKEQLDFYQINLEKCTEQVLQLKEFKLEPSESCSETSVKCLIKRETSDLSAIMNHDAAMDHLQDDLENALTSELIIKSEECSSEGDELQVTEDSYIRQNLKAESYSPAQIKDGLHDKLFIKSELECSKAEEDIQENADKEGGDLCQAWRRIVQQTKESAVCYQQVCHHIKMKAKKNIHVKESSKQKESDRDLVNVTSLSQTDSDKFAKDNENDKFVHATTELEPTKVQPSVHCNLCLKGFTSKGYLHKHLRIHSNEYPFKCDICCKCFKFKGNLTVHSKYSHNDVRSFACKVCGKMYKSKAVVKAHMNIHAVKLNFKCGNCDKKFKSKKLLSLHIKTHSTLRPYQCVQCYKRFKTRSHLSSHMSVHSVVRPFSCDICAKLFKSKRELKSHSFVHSTSYDFSCNLCPAKFKTKPYLLSHMKSVHSDARPFKCYDCGKSYKLKEHLRNHINKHLNFGSAQFRLL